MPTKLRDYVRTEPLANAAPGFLFCFKDTFDDEIYVLEGSGSGTGITVAQPVAVGGAINNNTSTNITTAAYVTLVASAPQNLVAIQILDTGGRFYVVALGPAASEVDFAYVQPGGSDYIYKSIPAGTRISIKAIDGNAVAGFTGINIYA
jgi:hypothetical protein